MTDAIRGHPLRERNRIETEAMSEGAETDREATLQDILDALDDPDCRAMLLELEEPRTASALSEACNIPSSTAYRKLDLLSEAGLVEERTTLREEYRQVTTYVRAFESVSVAPGEDGFEVTVEEPDEKPEDRLTAMWTEVQREV